MASSSKIVVFIGLNEIDLSKKYKYKSIRIEKFINKISTANIEIEDGNTGTAIYDVCDSDEFKCGGDIVIKAGYGDEVEQIFKGKIIEVNISLESDGSSHFSIVCRSVLYQLSLRRKSRYFENALDSESFDQILSEYPEIQKEIDPTEVIHESLVQQNITDWDFINMRAEANGHVVISDNEFLKIKKINSDQDPKQKIQFGKDIISMKLSQNSRSQLSSVEGKTWKSEELKYEETNSEMASFESFGSTDSKLLAESTLSEKDFIVDTGCISSEELSKVGESALNFSRASKINGEILINGNFLFELGKTIEIVKGSRIFEGKAYISGISHYLCEGSWQTKISIGIPFEKYYTKYNNIQSPPALGGIGAVSGLSIGTIKKISEDPKMMHRFFVNIPSIHKEEEGIWCRSLTLAAGEKSGVQFFPDKNSEVVIGFFNNDPRQGIVLGAMFGKMHNPPKEITDENLKQAFVTKEKLELSFDDEEKNISIIIPGDEEISIKISNSPEKKSITMQKGETNFIKIGDEGIEMCTNKDIKLSADGAINISGKLEAKFESMGETSISGLMTKVQGEAEAEVKGAGRVSLTADGETVVRGAIVMIN